jgi:hypothetical protein
MKFTWLQGEVQAGLDELVGKNWTRNWGFFSCNRCPEHGENSTRPSG